MAATASITRKNGFNKTRALKIALFQKLLAEVRTQSYPNGNSGYQQSVIFALAEKFPSTVVGQIDYGNPHSMGHVTFDPTHLTADEVSLIESWLKMVDGLPVDDFHPRSDWQSATGYWEDRRLVKRQSVFQQMQRDAHPYYHNFLGV